MVERAANGLLTPCLTCLKTLGKPLSLPAPPDSQLPPLKHEGIRPQSLGSPPSFLKFLPVTTLKGDDFLPFVILFYDLCRTVVFIVWPLGGVLKTILGAHEVKTDFIAALRCDSPLSLRCHLTDGVGAMAGQTAGSSVLTAAVAPKGTRSS